MLDSDFEDPERGVSAHASEESWRGRRLGTGPHPVKGVSIFPQALDPPIPAVASQQLGPQESVWSRGADETMETGQQLTLSVGVDRRANNRQDPRVHAPSFPCQAIAEAPGGGCQQT